MALVAAPTNLAVFNVTDRAGKKATVAIHCANTIVAPTDAGFVALKDAVKGMSDGALMSAELKKYAVNDAPGAADQGAYDTVRDKVIFPFVDEKGISAMVELPAPDTAILMSDGIRVNMTDPLVIAFIDAMIAAGASAEGNLLARSRPAYRKQNVGLKPKR